MMNRLLQLLVAACCVASSSAIKFEFENMCEDSVGVEEDVNFVISTFIPLVVDETLADVAAMEGGRRRLSDEQLGERVESWLADHETRRRLQIDWSEVCTAMDQAFAYLIADCEPYIPGRALRQNKERNLLVTPTDKIVAMSELSTLGRVCANSMCQKILRYFHESGHVFNCIDTSVDMCVFTNS